MAYVRVLVSGRGDGCSIVKPFEMFVALLPFEIILFCCNTEGDGKGDGDGERDGERGETEIYS